MTWVLLVFDLVSHSTNRERKRKRESERERKSGGSPDQGPADRHT